MRKGIIGIFICIILLLTVSTSLSLAWYAGNDELYISTVELSLVGNRQIQISTVRDDPEAYKEELKESDLKQVGVFRPVSSMFKEDWLNKPGYTSPVFLEDYTNSIDDYTIHPAKPKAATNGFFSQDIFLKSPQIDVYAALNIEESFINANEAKNRLIAKDLVGKEAYAGKSEEQIFEELMNLQKALRLSVLVEHPKTGTYTYTIVDPFKDGETKLGGVMDITLDGYYDYYVTNSYNDKYERLYGEVNNWDAPKEQIYSSPTGFDTPFVGDNTCFNASHKGDVHCVKLDQLDINEEFSASPDDVRYANQMIGIGGDIDTYGKKTVIVPLYSKEPTRIVVSYYLEGWDTDCVNSTMGACFSSKLTFEVLRDM